MLSTDIVIIIQKNNIINTILYNKSNYTINSIINNQNTVYVVYYSVCSIMYDNLYLYA